MDTKNILKKLTEQYRRNVIYFEFTNGIRMQEKYIIKLEFFNGPMWLFHLLRKAAFLFDKITKAIRKLIYKMTTTESLEDKLKFKV